MECDQAFLQVFRDQIVTRQDIKPDTRAIMLSDGAILERSVPTHVKMVVCRDFDSFVNTAIGCNCQPSKVFFPSSGFMPALSNCHGYEQLPNETDDELLSRMFKQYLPKLAGELQSNKGNHISYFNAIKRSVTDLVQKRATEVIDNISKEKEFVIGKRVSLVENISSEEHIDALKEGFAQSFPESHMSVEKSTDSYSLVLTVSNKTDLTQI